VWQFGPGPGPVLFDRFCHNNGITHRLTAPYSPTTTGKVERPLARSHLVENDRRHATADEAQKALDGRQVQHRAPQQSLGDRPPAERFALAGSGVLVPSSSVGSHMPGAQLLGFRIGGLTLHAWDLARGCGGDETLDRSWSRRSRRSYRRWHPSSRRRVVFGAGPSGTIGQGALVGGHLP
jgi:hypothetical protein